MTDLLPCPFCGSTNLRYEFAGSQGYICCDNCGTQGPCDEQAADPICDDDAAYAAWNRRAAAAPVAIPGEKYHEDMGPVTWWRLPVDEPPWVGTPNDSDWPGYHTHFTPAPTNPLNAHALPLPTPEAAND